MIGDLETYRFPMQSKLPLAKGLNAALLSFAYLASRSGSHRSGTKDPGSEKLYSQFPAV